MKRLLCLVIFCFIVNIGIAHAGDTDSYLAFQDEAKLFTGIVEDISNENIDIMVVKKIKGDVIEKEAITIPKFEYSVRRNAVVEKNPKKNDNLFIAMVGDKFFYSIKTTSTDPRTLKFVDHLTNESMNMQGDGIYERIEKKVNDGSYEEAEKRRQEELNKKDNVKVEDEELVSENDNSSLLEEKSEDGLSRMAVIIMMVSSVILAVIGIAIILIRRKQK